METQKEFTKWEVLRDFSWLTTQSLREEGTVNFAAGNLHPSLYPIRVAIDFPSTGNDIIRESFSFQRFYNCSFLKLNFRDNLSCKVILTEISA